MIKSEPEGVEWIMEMVCCPHKLKIYVYQKGGYLFVKKNPSVST